MIVLSLDGFKYIAKGATLRWVWFHVFVLLMLMPVYVAAEDVDVFFGKSSADEQALPNVLFVLDNSGSMNATDGDSLTRLDELKQAFTKIIDTVSGVNIGLAQFTNQNGAAIISKVQPLTKAALTAPVPVSTVGFDDIDPLIGKPNSAYTDSSSYYSSATKPTMKMGYSSSGFSSEIFGFSPVLSDDDLLVERRKFSDPSSSISNRSHYSKFGDNVFSAVRLHLPIPQNAIVTSAKITFSKFGPGIGKSDNNPLTYEVAALNANSHQSLDLYTSVGEMQAANWQEGTIFPDTIDWVLGPKNKDQELDITSLVQQVVKNALWDHDVSLNSVMTLMFKQKSGNGVRWLQGTGGSLPPTITFKFKTATGTKQEVSTAIRFPEVKVPGGAVIKSANLVLYPAVTASEGDVDFSVTAEASPDSPVLPVSGSSTTITGKTSISIKNNWTVRSADWQAGSQWRSPDITGVIQSMVNRVNWCDGSALTLLITPKSTSGMGMFEYESTSSPSAKFPELQIEYTLNPDKPPHCKNASLLSVGIAQNEDTGFQDPAQAMTIPAGDAPLDNAQAPKIALRFPNISVEKGATVNEASLYLTSAGDFPSGSVNLKIWFVKEDLTNPLSPSVGDITGRSYFSPPVTWTVSEPWLEDEVYKSIDISSQLEQIFALPDWDPGNNSIMLVVKPQGASARKIRARASRLELQVPLGSVSVDMSAELSKQNLKSIVNNMEGTTWTPLVDSLYEAARYFRGDPVAFGKSRVWEFPKPSPVTAYYQKLRVSHNSSWEGGDVKVIDPNDGLAKPDLSCQNSSLPGCETEFIDGSPKYVSPITSDCSSNHIVLLTDGKPNYNYVPNLASGSDPNLYGISNTISALSGCASDSPHDGEKCGRTLAKYLFENDQVPGKLESKVHVHTIAFNLSDPKAKTFLEDLASNGGGDAYSADSVEGLVGAFSSIIGKAINDNNVNTKPSVGISIFNKLFHQDSVYYSLFSPKRSAYWPGNIKGYYIKDIGVKDGKYEIVDRFDRLAIDPATGFFAASSHSRWSPSLDGDQILEGGVVSKLPPSGARKVYTDLFGSMPMDLTVPINTVALSNASLSRSYFGATATGLDRENAINFMLGKDILDADFDGDTAEDFRSIGDPLHSSPVTVTYDATDPANLEEVIFSAGNDGALRAFDAKTGEELWAFYIYHFLKNQLAYTQQGATQGRLYGMDSTPVMWYYDKQQDNKIDPSEDHVYLYLTMRRGGDYIYALDVTKKDKPKVLWRRKGGINAGPDYVNLGQTWSRPIKGRIQLNGIPRDVLIMGAGYNPVLDNDTNSVSATPGVGNGVLIIDAVSGAVIASAFNPDSPRKPRSHTWAFQSTEMEYAFAATPEVLDMNLDGFVDQVYIPDVNGQLWRFDINPKATSVSDMMTGGIIAKLNHEAPAPGQGARRFFNRPDISVAFSGGQKILAIALGSGEVTRPFNKNIQNRFYVIAQQAVFGPPSTYEILKEGDELTDVTGGFTGSSLGSGGWFINLQPTEKVNAASATFNQSVMFTTYSPPTTTPGTCTVPVGKAYFYTLRITNGDAGVDLDGSGSIDPINDRRKKLLIDVIPPGPTLILLENALHPLILVGPEQPLNDVNAAGLLDWQESYSEIRD